MAKQDKTTVTTTRWDGRPNYQCPRCPYSTLNQEAMRIHLRLSHRIADVTFEKPPKAEAANDQKGGA